MERKFAAFSLLELLIYLTIIGILMLVGMAGIPKLIDTANRKAVETEIESFRVAILNYKISNGSPPASLSDLLDNGYITQELASDPWNENYILTYKDELRSVEIRSAGSDKTADTEDDIFDNIEVGW